MGLFYTNITLRGPAQADLGDYLALLGRSAHISPTVNSITVVYDQECENQDYAVLTSLTERLSRHFRCPAMVACLHDDDIFWYRLYRDGEVLDEYNSTPDYFDVDATEPSPPSGGDAALLCDTFGAGEHVATVDHLLHHFVPDDEADDEPMPEDRHHSIVEQLGLPSFAAGIGFDSIEFARNEEGVNRPGFVKIGSVA